MNGRPLVKIVAWISLSFIAVATAFAEELNKDAITRAEQSYYAFIENDIKKEFDSALELLMKHEGNSSKKQMDDAADSIKTLYYNKANTYVSCVGEIIRSKVPAEMRDDAFSNCLKPRLVELAISQQLVSDYDKVFTFEATARCEMEARLFERELLLPPYEFLKREDGGTRLFDARVFNQCLRSQH
jgi:hypothetical protein